MTQKHIEEVCRLGKGKACCRYLGMIRGFICLKTRPDLKLIIDHRVVAGAMEAIGDNCPGQS